VEAKELVVLVVHFSFHVTSTDTKQGNDHDNYVDFYRERKSIVAYIYSHFFFTVATWPVVVVLATIDTIQRFDSDSVFV
jgi:hypothetical protein